MRRRTLSRVLAILICTAMVFDSQAVSVYASENIEIIEFLDNEIKDEDDIGTDIILSVEQNTDAVDANHNSQFEVINESGISENSIYEDSKLCIQDTIAESSDALGENNTFESDITLELSELIEKNTMDLSNANKASNSDLSQEAITILFRQHPEYLINDEYDSAVEDANDYAFQVQKTMTNQDMAVIMEAFNNGDKIVWDQVMSWLKFGDDYKTKQEKAMAWEIVEKYCSADTSLTTMVKTAQDDLKGINKIYNQTGSALKEALKTDLKQQNLQISSKEIDVIVDKSFKQVSSLQQVANESMTALGVCMEYIELVLVEEKIYSDLISICQNSGCEILVEQLTKIKKDRDDNFETYFVNHYLNEAVFKNIFDEVKDWVISNKNLNKAFNIKEINKLYSISKKVIEIVSEVYGSNNATVDDIVFSTMAENYYNAAHHEVHKYRKKFIENPGNITDEDIRMYEVAYKLELVSIQILSKYCWKIAYKVDKNSDLHMSMLMQKNEVDRLTYNKYLNSCLDNLRNDNVAIPAPEEEEEDNLQSIASRFSLIQMQFVPNVGQTWTATYGGCSQCFGFARLVFSMLFGCEMPSAYSSEKPYLYPNEINVIKVGQLVGNSVNSESVRNLLSQGRLGDIIQASGSVYGQHTMIFVGVGEGYVRVYDCNAAVNGGIAGSCTINEWNISFENFAKWYGTGASSGVTLYRASNYNEVYGDGDYLFYDDSVNFVIENGVLKKYNGWQRNVVIPEGVIAIGANAFDSNRTMQTVYIPESVTDIGNYAFYRCTSLKNVRFPNSVKSIGEYAFNGCSSLEEIILPSKLETIVEGAFGGCSSAKKIYIPKSLTSVESFISGAYIDGLFERCDNVTEIVFENGITIIPGRLFKNCEWLKSIDIPNTVTTIEGYAFSYCSGLESVNLPDALTSIGRYAFYRCTSLKNVRFPNSVKSIGEYSFNGCSSLEEIILPSKLETIVEGAFGGCSSAKKIYIPKSLTSVESFISGAYIDGLFERCDNVTEIVFENGITIIPGRLFENCEWLKSIDIPNTVTTIEGYAFSYCSGLESVILPDAVTTIERYAFYTCSSLEEINIPNTVNNMGSDTFYGCSSLKKVHLPETRQNIMPYMFYGCTSLEEINLPDTLKTIQQYAFYNCDSLKNIELPENVESIGSYAFNDCDALESFSMGDKVSEMGAYSFYHCDKLKDIRLSNALKTIPNYAFSDCAVLEKMAIPYNVTAISKNVFTNDAKLKEITIPRNTNTIDKDAFSYPLTIYGVAGTYAETYANANGHTFVNREINAAELEVLPENPVVNKNGQLQLVLNVTPSDFTDAITCKSTDTDILTVDNTGLVRGVGVGSASVKITVGSVSKTIEVRVKQPVTSIYVYPGEASLNAGETVELSASVYPYDAEDQKYVWESEDESIATVGDDGAVTAISKGVVKIYARAQDGSGVEDYCTITVLSNLYKVYSMDDFQSPHDYELNCSDIWEYTDEGAESLSITFSDDTEVEDKFDYIYIYDKDNKEIGKYTGKQLAGKTVTIKGAIVRVKLVSDDDGTAYGFRVVSVKKDAKDIPLKGISLTNSSIQLCKGDTSVIDVKYDPEDATVDENVKWTSDNDRIATVENGSIKGVGVGTTTIRAELKGKTAACKVMVTEKLSSIILEPVNVQLFSGQSSTSHITTNTGFIPAEGTTITNSNPSVASYTADLVNGTLTVRGLSEGNSVITVKVGDVEARADISVVTPKISFKDQDGSDLSLLPIEAVYGEKYPKLPVPVAEGKEFIGWYTGADCSGTLITSDTVFEGADLLYAAWVQNDARLRIIMSDEYKYTGSKINPQIRVYDGTALLTENTDYTIAYKNNTNAYTLSECDAGFSAKKAPTVIITGKGNYSSKETVYFKILPQDISGDDFDSDNIVLAYTGKNQKVTPALYWNGRALKSGMDYTAQIFRASDTGFSSPLGESVKEAGDYVICLTGRGNFAQKRYVDLKVTDVHKPVSRLSYSKVPDVSYTGDEIRPEPVVRDGKTVLAKDEHYTLSYESNTDVGTGYVIVTGMQQGGYAGVRRIAFKITGTPLKKATVSGIAKSYTYSGNEITLKDEDLKLYIKSTKKTPQTDLTKDTDYTVSYTNNLKAGTASIILKGIGGYTGTVKKTFKIDKYSITSNTEGRFIVNCAGSADYAKGGARPSVAISFRNADGSLSTLKEGTDYKLAFKNNTSLTGSKSPTVTVTGMGNYEGSRDISFAIREKDISAVRMDAADKVYKNKAGSYATSVILTDTDGNKLKAGKDYDKKIRYEYASDATVIVSGEEEMRASGEEVGNKDIIPAGTLVRATVTAKPGSGYTGTISGTYRIVRAGIGSMKAVIPTQEYTGREITLDPATITVKAGKTVLKPYDEVTGEGDYIITGYSDNIRKGKAKVTFRGVGNYGGTRTVTFNIRAKGIKWWWR